ncbi:MAG: hypothetical protein QNJ45_25420 [Ardenticatenaceae bacterium]|nr:hypothetical protein [Ardenticatenaceae bacterium]
MFSKVFIKLFIMATVLLAACAVTEPVSTPDVVIPSPAATIASPPEVTAVPSPTEPAPPPTEPAPPPTEPAAADPSQVLAGLVYRLFDDGLYRINDQGEATRLGDDELLPSPNLVYGAAVDFASAEPPRGAQTIRVVDLNDGSAINQNIPSDMRLAGCYGWQNDGVLLCSIRYPYEEDTPNLGHLARVDAHTGQVDVLQIEKYTFSPPAASADGRKIAYDTGNNEMMLWQDGASTPFDFAGYENGAFLPAQGVGSPAFSPDGQKIAVVFGGSPARYVVFDLVNGSAVEVASFEPLGFGGFFPAAVWNPTGERLAIQLLTNDPSTNRFIVVNSDGSELMEIGPGYRNPVWLDSSVFVAQQLVDGQADGIDLFDLVNSSSTALDLPESAAMVGWFNPDLSTISLEEVYEDPHAGVALNYPASWTVLDVPEEIKAESGGYAATFNSFDPNAMVGGSEGIPVGSTKFDLYIDNGSAPITFEGAVAQRRTAYEQSEFDVEILSEELLNLPSGLPAVRWRIDSAMGGLVTEVVIVVNERMIVLGGLGDQALIDQIVDTLRPLNEDQN